ncbi:MAG TPA: rhodanese-like domain-containing protein [Pyrinomonadaceae bacterium]|nr:rhodanese-like domain-containing protein [Pyrinomonadaceae bacterium]
MRKFLLGAAGAAALLFGGCKAEDGAAGPRAGASLQSGNLQTANASATPDEKGVRRVGPAELQKMIEAGEAVAVDVRVKGEYDKGHIKGSLSIPRTELPARLSELPKDKLVVFYCA